MITAGAPAFAFGAGLATFAAPCVFPLLPGYVAYFADQHGRGESAGPVRPGVAAAAGVLTVFAALALTVYVVGGQVLTPVGDAEPLVGGAVAVLGAVTLAGRGPSILVALPQRRPGGLGVFLFGGAYAVAAAGCTVPILLAVLAQAISMPPVWAVAVIGAYAAGVALPLVGVTVSAGYGYDILATVTSVSATTRRRLAGALMLTAGLVQVWTGLSVPA